MKTQKHTGWIWLLALAITFISSCNEQQNKTVSNINEFNKAVNTLQAGDTIILASKTWVDAQLVFEGVGTKEQPIVLIAEEPGKVILTGESNLKLAGEYLVVSGLIFIDGNTPSETVISFRKDSENLAYNTRVTNCVIDHYNPDNRFSKDTWVELHGRNNRLDHCYFGGKLNIGETVRVKLNNPNSLQNFHSIDHNYFGYRPRLGSNVGESMRVGTSTYSLEPSNTIIENNFFDECNGEVEAVSIKASDNIVRGNTFYECKGVLALRHGDRNIVENNIFIGNNKDHTGGVRVVNSDQIIRNNHFQELKGERFFGALPIMNGVPNSLINRYHHANNIDIENNYFFYCDFIEFGVGTDKERTEAPEDITFTNNVFYYPGKSELFTVLDDISTYYFKNNKASASATTKLKGVDESNSTYAINKDEGLYHGEGYSPKLIATTKNCGPQWYTPILKYYNIKSTGKSINVEQGLNSLSEAIKNSSRGDTLVLSHKEYNITATMQLPHSLTIVGKTTDGTLPVIKFKENEKQQPFIKLADGASLTVQNLVFNGHSPNGIASGGVVTSANSTINHYNFKAYNCAFINFNASRFTAFKAYKNTFADTIIFDGCLFYEISGDAIGLGGQEGRKGRYNAEYVIMKNCHFQNVMGSALFLYRGGNDESTLGPFLEVNHCSFININNKELGSALLLIGVQRNEIKNSVFQNSGRSGRSIKLEDPQWADSQVHNCRLYNSGRIESYYNRLGEHVVISNNSKMQTGIKGDDNKELGASISSELETLLK